MTMTGCDFLALSFFGSLLLLVAALALSRFRLPALRLPSLPSLRLPALVPAIAAAALFVLWLRSVRVVPCGGSPAPAPAALACC